MRRCWFGQLLQHPERSPYSLSMAPLMRFILLILVLLHETLCQCPPGYSTLFNNNQLVTCSPQNPCSCASIAAGYFCQYSSQNNQYVCCGVSSSQCPSSSAQMNNGAIQNCQSSNDCSSGYYCNQNTCCASPSAQCGGGGGNLQCANGQVLVNGVCTNTVPIGSFCQNAAVCTGGSQCLNNFCQCANGQQNIGGQCQGNGNNGGQCGQGSVLVNNQCVVSPGQSCTSTQRCLDNSVCSNLGTGTGTCTCQNNLQQINGYCVAAPTGSCQASQVLINGVCQTFSTLNGPCVGNAQCVGGSSCINNFCSCSGNTQSVTLTSNGVSRGYCLSNSNNNNFCQSGQVNVNGQCLQQIQLGQFGCSSSLQCTTSMAQCTSGMCQCQTGTIQQNGQCIQGGTGGGNCQLGSVMVNGVCTQMVSPGSQCSGANQCLDNAICNSNGGMTGQCVCSNNGQIISGYCMPQSNGFCTVTQTYINGQCLTYSIVGGSCQADQQCIGGSNCLQNTCQCTQNKQRFCTAQNGFQSCYCISPTSTGISCQSGQVLVNGQCMNTVQIGSFGCQFTQQCLGNSQCSNGMCQCPSGTVQQGSQCIASTGSTSPSAPGSFCSSSSSQCLDGSTCTFNNCTCQNGGQAVYGYCLPPKTDFCSTTQVMMNGQCVTYSVIGGSCLGDKQCLGGSFCNGGSCACRSGVQQTCIGFNQCYCQGGSGGTIPIGGFGCSTSQQCSGNAQCSNGQCQCGFGQVQQGNQCVTSGNGGTCQSYQVQFNGQCLDTVSIGQQCTNQVQCQITNAICSGTCTCSSGFTYDGTGCIMSSTFCPQGTVSVSNTCRSLVALGQFCQSSAVCLGFGICGSNQMCACPTGSTNINNVCRSTLGCNANQVAIGNQCYNKVALGQSCMATQQCPQNAQCLNSICTCPSGTTNYGNGICTGGSSEGDLCAAGETPQYSNNQLINCLTSACPSASYCKYNSRYSQYVCCRPQSSTLTCANPAFSVVYQNGSPLNCLLSQCPTNSICEYNNSSGQYVCCQAGNGNPPSSTCTGNYYTYSNGFPFVCTSDSSCTSTSSNYRYCRQAPGQTFSVCCDRS